LRPSDAPRLLIVPGLNDSGPAHWQSWLQTLNRGALRVQQDDWASADLDRWACRIGRAIANAPEGPLIAAAHSFGCLALAHHLAQVGDSRVVAALLVAPADPARFGFADRLAHRPLAPATTVVASETDPWMSAAQACRWARTWGSRCVNLGDAGHINAEAGFGPLPLAARWVEGMRRRWARPGHPGRTSIAEWQFSG